jgi:peptidyl-prolyl cis-trans isomerase A (cyclophilin A)
MGGMRIPVLALVIVSAAPIAGAQRASGAPRPTAGAPAALRSPNAAELAKAGPDSFDVAVHTSKGVFTARVKRSMAPKGADRVWHAVQAHYYDGVRFFRVIPGFMAQFGFHGDPVINRTWDAYPLKDEPLRGSNTRGVLTFATRGPNSRTVQLFVNTGNNLNLDKLGFSPVGVVTDGMAVVDSLYAGYGEGYPRGDGPDQDKIIAQGNAYLNRSFPKLDRIDSARVVRRWP